VPAETVAELIARRRRDLAPPGARAGWLSYRELQAHCGDEISQATIGGYAATGGHRRAPWDSTMLALAEGLSVTAE